MSKAFHLKILAIEKTFYDGDAISLNFQAFDGAYQILASHEPVVMAVKEGIMRFRIRDDEGNEIKIRGKKNVYTYFQTHPVEARKLYDRCYDRLRQKEDPFILAFSEMLNSKAQDILSGIENTEEL